MLYDPKTDAEPRHLLNGSIYSSAVNSAALDLARHDCALILASITAVGTAATTVQLQDSADEVSFADVSGQSFSEPVNSATNAARFLFVRAADVRRYVRIRVVPGGTITMSSSAVMLSSTQAPVATAYSIDTTP